MVNVCHDAGKPVLSSAFLTRSDTNWPVQSHKKVRILKFWEEVK